MTAKPIALEKLKQVLELAKQGQSIKRIVRLTGLSRNTVRTYLARINEQVIDNSGAQSYTVMAGIFYNHDVAEYKIDRYQHLLHH